MNSAKSIERLIRQRELIAGLKPVKRFSPEFTKWQRDTEVAIERIFGRDSRHKNDFTEVSYSLGAFSSSTPDHEFQQAYVRGLDNATAVLSSLIDEISEYSAEEEGVPAPRDTSTIVERLCLRFHSVARQLQARHGGRATIQIDDEYDVQDLLHALLRIQFDDVRTEEWTPSYAGGSSRMDFLLKPERVVIEVKKTRVSMSTAALGEQLLVDIAKYSQHPDCDLLVCFIYDPEGRVGNPIGLERDLEAHGGKLSVRVMVGPKS